MKRRWSNASSGKYIRFLGLYERLIVLCSDVKCLRLARRALEEAGWERRGVAVLLNGLRQALAHVAGSACG